MTRLIIPCLLLLFALSDGLYAQLSSKEVDQLAENVIEKFNLAGMAIGIVKDGEVIHSKGYGVSSVKSGKKTSSKTLFGIASNSKAFTSAALAILVEQGKIGWHDKVVDYLPEFKMYNDYVTTNFNIQDLLTHRSGLGIGAGDLMFIPPGADFTIEDILTGFQYFEPQSDFRASYDYDNLLYIIAGELIARVSGMSWEEFMDKNIFTPLGMNNAYGSVFGIKDNNNLSIPHLLVDGKLTEIAHSVEIGNGAAGGIYASVEDLCRWMLVHLNQGKYGNDLSKQLFTGRSQREMWRIFNSYVTHPNKRYNIHFSGYGLGWELADIRGNMVVHHGGLLPGMASQTLIVPDLNLGIVVLINTADKVGFSPVDVVAYTIFDSYLGLEDNDWVNKIYNSVKNGTAQADSVTNAVWNTVKSADNSKVIPQNYTGIYEDPWFGKVEIFLKDEDLWFRSSRSPKLNGKMHYYKANAFAIKWEYQDMNADAFAIFSLDEEGKAQQIKMKGISPEIDFSFDFQDLDLRRVE